MAKKEEELIQLVLTQKEAMILCSITSLGLKLLRKDVEGGKITLVILEKIIKTWPSEAITLSGKMLSLITVTAEHAKKELSKTKVVGSRIKEV